MHLNAGILSTNLTEKVNPQQLEKMVNVNIYQYSMLLKLLLNKLLSRKDRSAAIATLSMMSIAPQPPILAYGATKHITTILFKCLETELSQTKLDFLALSPYGIHTPLVSGLTRILDFNDLLSKLLESTYETT